MLTLPPELKSAIAAALRTLPASQWQSAARSLSLRYRTADTNRRHQQTNPTAQPSGTQQSRTKDAILSTQHSALSTSNSLGYLGFVLPAAYAQLYGALQAVTLRAPSFQPTTMLDIGSGPGTALWAAAEHFPTLTSIHAYERETAFITLGKNLAQSSPNLSIRDAHWRQINLTGPLPNDTPTYDLVIIGHALNEMSPPLRDALVQSAWDHCSGLLLIVEPGTSSAFPIILRARELLIPRGAHTIAPCAHDLPCPLPAASSNHDWCHFPRRLQRPQFQRIAKEASAGWEEAKFTYAALARFPQPSPIWGRLLHQPHETKTGVDLTVSAADATIQTPHIPKKHPLHKPATHLAWGDPLTNSTFKIQNAK